MTPLTYQEILDSELDPGSPMNQSLFLRLARNWEAAFGGADGAPGLSPAALSGTVIAAGDDYHFVSHSYEGFANSWGQFFGYTFLQPGSVRVRVRYRRTSTGSAFLRMYHNGALVGDWTTGSGTTVEQVIDVSVAISDVITFEARAAYTLIESVSFGTDGERVFPFTAVPGSWSL